MRNKGRKLTETALRQAEAERFLTVKEWAELMGKPLERPQVIKLGMQVKDAYKKKYDREPRKAYRRNDNDRLMYVGLGYEPTDLPIILESLQKIEPKEN